MRSQQDAFEALGVQMLAVDPHETWSAKHLLKEVSAGEGDLTIPLLADPSQVVSGAYGVAFQMRIHTELSNRPATFVIDRAGVLRYAHRGTSFSDRPRPADLLTVIRGLPAAAGAR